MVCRTAFAAVTLLLTACGTMIPEAGSARKADPWSGNYRLHWLPGTQAAAQQQPVQRVQIRAITSEMHVPGAKSGQDGPQWAISFVEEAGEPLPLMPFAAKDYQDLALTYPQNATQTVECMEAGSLLFVCRTPARTQVRFGDGADDQLTTTTGLFGVTMHQGGFELTPLD